MVQDAIFLEREGNSWFSRNKEVIINCKKDFPVFLTEMIEEKDKIKKVAELGCSNGWRLNLLSEKLAPDCEFKGMEPSKEAVDDGNNRYSKVKLTQGLISDVPFNETFDLVIVNYVLHWVDRPNLAKAVSEIDRLVKDGGYLVLGDFLPDFQQRRHYHHLPEEKIYTYKQDYAKIFEALGTYKEKSRMVYNHDERDLKIQICDSNKGGFCSVLHKSLYEYYPEI